MNKKKIIIIICVVLVVAVLVGIGINNFKKQEATSGVPKNAVSAQIEEAHTEKIVTKVNVKGTAQLVDKTVVYPETQARIKTLHVKVGDVVSVGQKLATYDDESLKTLKNQLDDAKLALTTAQLGLSAARLPASQAELISGESQLTQAERAVTDAQHQIDQLDLSVSQTESSLEDKEASLENTKFLYEQGVISKTDYDLANDTVKQLKNQLETTLKQRATASAVLESANASLTYAKKQAEILINKQNDASTQNNISRQEVLVEQANLRIEQLEKEINDFKHEEIAKVSGTVLDLYAVEGDTASFARPLMDIGDLSNKNMVVRVNVPENRTSGIQLGQDVEIKGDALGKKIYEGKVTKIFPQAEVKQIGNSMETVIVVEVSPTDDKTPIKPGFTLETDIITKVTESAVVVPLMSVATDDDGKDFVYVVSDDFSVEKRLLELGDYSGLYVEADGINEGEKVILSPTPQVKEGVFVKPLLTEDETK